MRSFVAADSDEPRGIMPLEMTDEMWLAEALTLAWLV